MLGFEAMEQDPCLFKCTPFKDKPLIIVSLYVDDFIYFSKSDALEEWFEQQLEAQVKVEDFMGDMSWFLGCS